MNAIRDSKHYWFFPTGTIHTNTLTHYKNWFPKERVETSPRNQGASTHFANRYERLCTHTLINCYESSISFIPHIYDYPFNSPLKLAVT